MMLLSSPQLHSSAHCISFAMDILASLFRRGSMLFSAFPSPWISSPVYSAAFPVGSMHFPCAPLLFFSIPLQCTACLFRCFANQLISIAHRFFSAHCHSDVFPRVSSALLTTLVLFNSFAVPSLSSPSVAIAFPSFATVILFHAIPPLI